MLPTINEVLPFDKSHLDLFEPRSEVDNFNYYKKNIAQIHDLSFSITLISNNEIVGCGGVIPLTPGMGECWMVSSTAFDKYKTIAIKTIRSFIDFQMLYYNRLQMAVLVDFNEANVFAKWLGFEHEGLMKSYDVFKRDYNLYARVK